MHRHHHDSPTVGEKVNKWVSKAMVDTYKSSKDWEMPEMLVPLLPMDQLDGFSFEKIGTYLS